MSTTWSSWRRQGCCIHLLRPLFLITFHPQVALRMTWYLNVHWDIRKRQVIRLHICWVVSHSSGGYSYYKTCSHLICDMSTYMYIIGGRTTVTQITGTGLKKESKQQRGRFTSHVVKSVLASSDCASKERGVNMIHSPQYSCGSSGMELHCAVCNPSRRHE